MTKEEKSRFDEIWVALLWNSDNDIPKEKLASALLPLFEEYVDFDQQGLCYERDKYLMLKDLTDLVNNIKKY